MTRVVFIFDKSAVMRALQLPLETAFPDSRQVSLEARPDLDRDDVLALTDSAARGSAFVVGIRTNVAPDAEELCAFVRRTEERFLAHERMAISVPVFVENAVGLEAAMAAALPQQRSFLTHFTTEPVFAVKASVIELLLPQERRLASQNWGEFARDINPYGFSVERLTVAIRMPDHRHRSPFSLPDFACFFAMSMEQRDGTCAIDLSALPVTHSGSTEYTVSVTRALAQSSRGERKWVVLATPGFREAFHLDDWNVEIVDPGSIERVYDLVFVPYQIYSLTHLRFLASISVRYVLCILDVIGLRCDYIRAKYPHAWTAGTVTAEYAEALLSLSRTDADDVRAYFESEGIHLAVEPVLITKDVLGGPALDEPPYVLILGNAFQHKAIDLFLEQVLASPPPIRLKVLADIPTQVRYGGRAGIEVLVSGGIPEARMESLYDHALAIVFPSVYEGFGLPVAAGLLRGRPVLGIDNAMNRELKAAFDEGSLLTLLPSHAAMAAALHSLDRLESRTPPRHVRTWAQVAAETDEILRQAQDRPIDWARVFGRTREIHRILDVTRAVAPARDDLSFRQLSSLFLKKTARAIRRRIPASAAKKEGT